MAHPLFSFNILVKILSPQQISQNYDKFLHMLQFLVKILVIYQNNLVWLMMIDTLEVDIFIRSQHEIHWHLNCNFLTRMCHMERFQISSNVACKVTLSAICTAILSGQLKKVGDQLCKRNVFRKCIQRNGGGMCNIPCLTLTKC